MWTIRKILVPTDFSPGARAAAEHAIVLARLSHASLTVFHVYELPAALMASAALISADTLSAIEQIADRSLHEFVAGVEKELMLPGEERPASGIQMGPPALTIVDQASRGGYDLIVMGTHGRTGFKRVFIGSVAERVVRLARCPVLTIHSAESADQACEPNR